MVPGSPEMLGIESPCSCLLFRERGMADLIRIPNVTSPRFAKTRQGRGAGVPRASPAMTLAFLRAGGCRIPPTHTQRCIRQGTRRVARGLQVAISKTAGMMPPVCLFVTSERAVHHRRQWELASRPFRCDRGAAHPNIRRAHPFPAPAAKPMETPRMPHASCIPSPKSAGNEARHSRVGK